MKVTVILPNYNGLKFMETCMASLARQNYKEFHTLIVDNGSTDGSADYIKEHYPQAQLIETGENLGFSGAVNIGIRSAGTPYVLLLNNDTEADPDFVGEMVNAIERSERVFSASSKMIQMYHKELMDDAGDMYSLLGWAVQRGVGQGSDGYNRPCRVFSACAGAAIYRKSVFEEIGYFDESHFAYLEDLDVGYRAKIAGYDNIYWPKAVVYHVGSGTSADGSKYSPFKVKLAARNSVYVNYKNMPALQLLINLPCLFIGHVLKYAFFCKTGFGKDYLAGLLEGIRTVNKCKKVKFSSSRLLNYVKIECELIWGTLVYVCEFTKRKVVK